MSIMFRETESRSDSETFALGEAFGKAARPGTVIALCGDLGAGKTVFAKGFAKGLGITETVNSPTFTILQVYDGGRMPFYHFDVYRIDDISEMDEIGFDEYTQGEGASLIEWADLIEEILPEETIRVTIERMSGEKAGTDGRRIRIDAPDTASVPDIPEGKERI